MSFILPLWVRHILLTPQSSLGFVAFDKIKSLLQDENGKISGPRTVIAGFGAGTTESLLAVTPFESIKTQMSVIFVYSCNKSPTDSWNILALTTGNPRTLACVALYTVVRLFSRKEVSGVSSRVSCPQQHDRLPTQQQDSRAIQL